MPQGRHEVGKHTKKAFRIKRVQRGAAAQLPPAGTVYKSKSKPGAIARFFGKK